MCVMHSLSCWVSDVCPLKNECLWNAMQKKCSQFVVHSWSSLTQEKLWYTVWDFFQSWYVSKMVLEPGKVWLQVSSAQPRMSKISIWECIKWENCCRVSLGYWWKICTAAQAVWRQENFLIWFKENLSLRISHPIPTRYWREKAWQKIMVCRWILSHFNFRLIF